MEIAVIGAGSQFTLSLLRALYQQGSTDDYHIRFMDVRAAPLEALEGAMPRLNAAAGRAVRWSCHEDRVSAIEGADHVLACFAVSFPDAFLRTCCVLHDHGIRFVEGETATPGALMATLRHLPPLVSLARDLRQHAAGAWLHIINNPMPRLVRGVIEATGHGKVVGHCHGTLDTRRRIAELVACRPDDVDLFVAGINHFHVVQRAVHRGDGRDLLAVLADLPDDRRRQWREHDFTQWRMYEELGYVIGHGNWHNFDYCPYSNPRLFRYAGYNTWERACLRTQALRQAAGSLESASRLQSDEDLGAFLRTPESEQIFAIMQALSGERPRYLYLSGNMPNRGHLPQLPEGAIVELPATVSTAGVEMIPSDRPLPLFFESWLQQQLTIHELSVRAALDSDRRSAVEAIVSDPSFRDCDCPPAQLLDEMLSANAGLVPAL